MPFVIQSKDNDKIKWAAKLVSQSRFRKESGLFVLEGLRLCLDAVATGRVPEAVFYTAGAASREPALEQLFCLRECYEVSESAFAKMSDTKSPQGVLCILKREEQAPFCPRPGDRYMLLEQVQNPANLGAVARTAEALGITGLVVTGDGCDVTSPKAQRAAMGSLLRLPTFVVSSLDQPIAAMRCASLPVYAAVPGGGAADMTECDFSHGAGVIVGNEANGLREQTIAACDGRITVPMRGRAESLNAAAAAAILMWEMVRPSLLREDGARP